jgi:hypothetical protein
MDFLCRKGLLLFAFSIPLALLPLCARTLTFDEEKCRIDVPDTWTEKAVPESRASYFNADKTKFVAVRIVQVGQKTTFDNPAFLQSYEDQIVAARQSAASSNCPWRASMRARSIRPCRPAPGRFSTD